MRNDEQGGEQQADREWKPGQRKDKKPRYEAQRLTIKRLERIARDNAVGAHSDIETRGLSLIWRSKTSASWQLRFEHRGRERVDGLGSLKDVSIEAARERAGALRARFRAMIADGIDPIAVKRAEKEERKKLRHQKATPARTMTFRQVAEAYCESREAEWSHAKHRHQVQRTLETFAFPEIGDLNVAEITTAHVLRVLSPIWSSKRETASRVRGRIEAVLDAAKGLGFRAGDNPAQWKLLKSNLAGRGRKVQRNHHASLPFAMMNAFLTELAQREGIAARALEFAILTASRTNEVLGAVASEIDLKAKVWTIPPERMKAGRRYRIPLSSRALQLLGNLPSEEGNDFIFVGGSKGGRLANDAMMRIITKMENDRSPVLKQIGHATPHGFRASFRQWGRELRIADFEVLEAALAHSIRSDTVNAYVQDSDLLDARRPLMELWSRYCSTPVSGDNVVSLPSRVVR